MQLDQEAIIEFKELYLKEYGIRLSNEEALDYGIRLIKMIKAVYGDRITLLFDKKKQKAIV